MRNFIAKLLFFIVNFLYSLVRRASTKATRAAPIIQTRKYWIAIIKALASDMVKRGTIYGWKSPVNEKNAMKQASCVSFVALALQRLGYLPSGQYINFQSTGKLHGNGASWVKSHGNLFKVLYPNKTPQQLKGVLKEGDIVGYKAHIMIFAGWKGNTPLWYSLERNGSKGYGKKPRIDVKKEFSYYNTRKIDAIVKLTFKDEQKTQPKPATTAAKPKPKPVATHKQKYKTKMPMNIRQSANAYSKKVGMVPKGYTLVPEKISGVWAYINHANVKGWINISSKYCTKL